MYIDKYIFFINIKYASNTVFTETLVWIFVSISIVKNDLIQVTDC